MDQQRVQNENRLFNAAFWCIPEVKLRRQQSAISIQPNLFTAKGAKDAKGKEISTAEYAEIAEKKRVYSTKFKLVYFSSANSRVLCGKSFWLSAENLSHKTKLVKSAATEDQRNQQLRSANQDR